MKDKFFMRLIISILIAGMISTVSLIFYTFHLQKESSLTAFIATEAQK